MAGPARFFEVRVPSVMRMSERLYLMAMMWRASGCLFIARLDRRNLDRARVRWKSFYTLYSLLCAGVLFSFRILQIHQGTHNASDSKGALISSLLLFMRNVIGLESIVAFIIMSIRSKAILRFLRNAAALEASMAVPTCHRAQRQYPLPYACNVFSFAAMSLYTFGHFGWSLITAYHYMTTTQIAQMLYAMAANALYMTSDYGNKATVRAACEVFVDYIRIQVDILEQKRDSRPAMREIEEVRANMAAVQALKEEINSALNPCILFFCLRAFSVVCIGGYMLVRLGLNHSVSVLILFYLLSTTFALIDLAFVSHAMEDEVAEAVVTYTVIFIQTGDVIINTFQPVTNTTDQQKYEVEWKYN
ncbi:hypothetical protein HPB50_026391 [Hyalomma asiaticum]|uniref:Uncharacterized protein n=1 Tax=Hyalomma asiaticum TaxID=266040 RepID=A0ACB7RRT9_HYAAI|nr:hypothetical protein HPB50_026391 [Hyalomma asiaticum]